VTEPEPERESEPDPDPDHDATDLLPSDRVAALARDGEMTQITRGRAYAAPGDRFEAGGATFVVTDVAERTLGDLTDADARREGSASLDAYRERMVRAHGGSFDWDDSAAVVTHRFERVD